MRAIQRDIKENPAEVPATLMKLPPLKNARNKNQPRRLPAAGNRKKSEKVIDKIPPR